MDSASTIDSLLRGSRSHVGWGLIELVVALSVVALATCLSVPSLAGQTQRSAARSVSSLCRCYAAAAQVEAVGLGVPAALLVDRQGAASLGVDGVILDPAAGLTAGSARANQPSWGRASEDLRVDFAPPFGAPAGGGTLRVGDSYGVVVRVASGLTLRRAF